MKTIPLLLALACAPCAFAAEFHFAPNGSDTHPGSAQKPFATLEHARDAARAAGGKNTVVLESGTYRLTKTFELDEKDSGTLYKGKPGARITGSISIPNRDVKPVIDPAVLERLCPEVRGKVLEIDLKALGVASFGEIGPRGFGRPYLAAPVEMFVDGVVLSIAKWPNPGSPGEPIGKVIDKGSVPRQGEKPGRGGTFTYRTDRPARWMHAKDIWITGLFHYGYADDTVKIQSVDLERRTLTTVQPHLYGFSSGKSWNRWTALNLLEEIDLPGESMADKESGKFYFLPPEGADMKRAAIEVSVLDTPLVRIACAQGVVFDGVGFECSRGTGVDIAEGSANRIENGTLRNLGQVAVSITSGTRNGVSGCKIHDIGAGAIQLGGGDRKSLTPAENFVENCEMHHFNRWDRSYKAAVNIGGVGNRIAHCLIHDAPGSAILLSGNDHLVEYNEIHHVMMSGDDMGGYYSGRNPSERGNVLRFNYWHDLAQHNSTAAIYFDDSGCDGSTVYGNVFFRAGAGLGTIFIAGGSDMTVKNNLFVDCKRPVYTQAFRAKFVALFKKKLADVGFDQSPWTEHYPGFKDYFKKKKPFNNQVLNNLVTKASDARFVDGTHGNFAMKPGADTGIHGFQAIPFDKIGLEKKP